MSLVMGCGGFRPPFQDWGSYFYSWPEFWLLTANSWQLTDESLPRNGSQPKKQLPFPRLCPSLEQFQSNESLIRGCAPHWSSLNPMNSWYVVVPFPGTPNDMSWYMCPKVQGTQQQTTPEALSASGLLMELAEIFVMSISQPSYSFCPIWCPLFC